MQQILSRNIPGWTRACLWVFIRSIYQLDFSKWKDWDLSHERSTGSPLPEIEIICKIISVGFKQFLLGQHIFQLDLHSKGFSSVFNGIHLSSFLNILQDSPWIVLVIRVFFLMHITNTLTLSVMLCLFYQEFYSC